MLWHRPISSFLKRHFGVFFYSFSTIQMCEWDSLFFKSFIIYLHADVHRIRTLSTLKVYWIFVTIYQLQIFKNSVTMTQHEKTLRKLLSKPTPTDLTWNELATLFKYLGYEKINNDGSRRKFVSRTSGRKVFIHKPHPQPTLKVYVVKQIIETLKLHGHI